MTNGSTKQSVTEPEDWGLSPNSQSTEHAVYGPIELSAEFQSGSAPHKFGRAVITADVDVPVKPYDPWGFAMVVR